MKSNPRKYSPGFTLIELMSVIIIIVILAGMVIGGLGYVNEKQARSKAQVQIGLLSKALEEYKLDRGEYPPTPNKTGTVIAPMGTKTSNILFKALYFDSDNDNKGPDQDNDQKIYIPELDPVTSKQGWTFLEGILADTKIVDPWGNEYCYRTAKSSTGSTNTATQNPDFDLWSMGPNRRSNPGGTTSANKIDNRDDIYN